MNRTHRLLLTTTFLFAVMALPMASAASVPVIGEVEGDDYWTISLLILAGAGIGSFFIKPVRNFVRRVPGGKTMAGSQGIALGIVALLAAAYIAPGGMAFGGQTASAADISDAAAAYEDGTFEPTSDITFTGSDYEDKTALGSVAVKLYKPDATTEKLAFEGSATPEYSATMSSGTVTMSGIQTQTLGCTVDVHLSVSGYYEELVADQDICVAKNLLGNNDKNVPTFYMKDIGTLSLASTATSLTCTAGNQCTYTLVIKNTEDDSWVKGVAAKWLDTDADGTPTLDNVDSGACELVEVSGVQYIKFQNDLGPLAFATCVVKITRPSGDTDGTFTWTLDDLFQYYGASGWATNSNILSASATSATTVSFA